jgi:hypothetical protein
MAPHRPETDPWCVRFGQPVRPRRPKALRASFWSARGGSAPERVLIRIKKNRNIFLAKGSCFSARLITTPFWMSPRGGFCHGQNPCKNSGKGWQRSIHASVAAFLGTAAGTGSFVRRFWPKPLAAPLRTRPSYALRSWPKSHRWTADQSHSLRSIEELRRPDSLH